MVVTNVRIKWPRRLVALSLKHEGDFLDFMPKFPHHHGDLYWIPGNSSDYLLKCFPNISRLRRFIVASFALFIVHTLILVLELQCSTRLATCNFSENELIAKFARVSTSLKLPGIQYLKVAHTLLKWCKLDPNCR